MGFGFLLFPLSLPVLLFLYWQSARRVGENQVVKVCQEIRKALGNGKPGERFPLVVKREAFSVIGRPTRWVLRYDDQIPGMDCTLERAGDLWVGSMIGERETPCVRQSRIPGIIIQIHRLELREDNIYIWIEAANLQQPNMLGARERAVCVFATPRRHGIPSLRRWRLGSRAAYGGSAKKPCGAG